MHCTLRLRSGSRNSSTKAKLIKGIGETIMYGIQCPLSDYYTESTIDTLNEEHKLHPSQLIANRKRDTKGNRAGLAGMAEIY
jgi:hypothetical protein